MSLKRTRNQQNNSENEFDSDAHVSKQRITQENIVEAILSDMMTNFNLTEEEARDMFKEMYRRMEEHVESSGLVRVNTKDQKARMEQILDTFQSNPDNAKILDLFTGHPTREEAIKSMSDNLRNNIKARKNRESRQSKLDISTPARYHSGVGLDTNVKAVNRPSGAPKVIGLNEKTILFTKDLGNSKDNVFNVNRLRIKDIYSQGATEFSIENVSWKKWLDDLEFTTCFRRDEYSIHGLIKGDPGQISWIRNETLFKRFLEMENETCGPEIFFTFMRVTSGEATVTSKGKQQVQSPDTRHDRTSLIQTLSIPIRSRLNTPQDHSSGETSNNLRSSEYLTPTGSPENMNPRIPAPDVDMIASNEITDGTRHMDKPRETIDDPSDFDEPNETINDLLCDDEPGQMVDSSLDINDSNETVDEPQDMGDLGDASADPENESHRKMRERLEEIGKTGHTILDKIGKSMGKGALDEDVIREALENNLTMEMRNNLISKAGRKETERISRESFENAARFFKIELFQLFDTQFRSDLQGMFKKSLKVTQLHAIYYMLHNKIVLKSSSILCDAPGYGKTYTTMAIMVIFKLMADNKTAVRLSRKNKDNAHLEVDKDGTCPTGSGYFFDCACMRDSLAAHYVPTKGINIICTTAAGVVKMIGEWVAFVPEEHRFKLYVDTENKRTALKKLDLENKTELWSKDAMRSWMTNPETGGRKSKSESVVLFVFPTNWTTVIQGHEREIKKDFTQTVKANIIKKLYNITREEVSEKRFNKLEKNIIPFHVGRMILDECHGYHGKSHALIKWLDETDDNIDLYPQTGTPFNNNGLEPIEKWILLCAKHNNRDPSMFEDMPKINNQYEKAISKQNADSMASAVKKITEICEQCYMIKRDGNTTWLDDLSPINCPPTDTAEVFLDIEDKKLKDDFEQMRQNVIEKLIGTEKISETIYINATRMMNQAATIPRMIRLRRDKKATYAVEAFDYNDSNTWTPRMRAIIKGSPKLDYIETKLMPKILPGEWKEGDKAPTKILIFAQYPFTAGMIYLWLKDKYGTDSTMAFMAKDSQRKRVLVNTIFDTNEDAIERLENEDQERREKAMFLVTTYTIACEALDFKACEHVWLIEPPYHQNKVQQAIARAAREGQKNKVQVVKFAVSDQERSMLKCNNLVDQIQELTGRKSVLEDQDS